MPIWNGCQPVLWCHVLSVPGNGAGLWGAVRWGGLITVSCTCAHIRHATLLYFLLHFHTRTHTHVMLQVRYCTFSRTSTLMSCYATVCWLALPHADTHTHTRHATSALLYILSNFHTHVLLRYCTFSCTSTRAHTHVMLQVRYCTFSRASTLMSFYTTVLSLAVPHAHIHTHTSCYMCATVHSLALNVMLCYCTFTRTHTHVMLQVRYCTFSRASILLPCHATVRCLAPLHTCHATLLCVLFAPPHSWHATLLYAPCLPHPCHATLCIRSLALAHICHATLLYVLSHIDTRTHVML